MRRKITKLNRKRRQSQSRGGAEQGVAVDERVSLAVKLMLGK